ncbi:MAG: hypothetical protein WBQ09_12325 [Terriglobales bacterium]|jgi:hypothetical protein
MPIPKIPGNKTKVLIAVAFLGWMTVLACTVDVKDRDGDKSKVDIQTPVGGIHVDEQANVRDTGLALYPGARQKEKKDNDSKNANVNISSSFFGVKVVAVEYESDDPPSKVQAFYQDQLKKFGHVIQCRTDKHGGDLTVKAGHESSKREVRCDGNDSGNVVELKVGTEDNQHMVSVEAQGSGTDFALVFIQTRGKEGTI